MKCHYCTETFQRMCGMILVVNVMVGCLPTDSFAENNLPAYVVQKAVSPVKIDGKIDEVCWERAHKMEFLGIADGALPPWKSYGKMLWDNDYFYIGIYIEDPDVWASLDPELPEPVVWHGHESEFIMRNDGFGKIFFDTDGDGETYVEVHINALNKVDDWYFVLPWHIKGREHYTKPDNWHLEWDYQGLKTAVFVDGTINDPGDIDKGWSLEAAFPWECLKPITKGNCPPMPGDTWRAHLGRVYKNAPRTRNMYYTWPVIGVVDCHRLRKWGYITFAKEFKEIVYEQ